MCERALVWLAAALLTASGVRAQAPSLDAQAARIDSLVIVHEQIIAKRIELQDSMRRHAQRVETDTALIGPIRFIDSPRVVRRRTADLMEAWRGYAPFVDGGAARLDSVVITATLTRLHLPDPSLRITQLSEFTTVGHTARTNALVAVGTALASVLPDTLQKWLDRAVPGQREPEWIYRRLATSPARAARECLDGDVESCIAALALRGPGAALETWYAAADLPDIVRRRRGMGADVHRCAVNGDHAACVREIEATGGPPPPLPTAARASLVLHALDLGGTGAWTRLATSQGDVGAALEAAAGRPLQEIVTSWRAEVIAARPHVHAGVARMGAWSLLWVLVLGALATRSTRWRLG